MAQIDFCKSCPFVWTTKCKPDSKECIQHKATAIELEMKEQAEYDEYCKRMRFIADISDTEQAHLEADALLCEVLRKLGFHELVTTYESITKWYG